MRPRPIVCLAGLVSLSLAPALLPGGCSSQTSPKPDGAAERPAAAPARPEHAWSGEAGASPATARIGGLEAGAAYSVSVALTRPDALGTADRFDCRVDVPGLARPIAKSLHWGDADLYTVVRPGAAGALTCAVERAGGAASAPVRVSVVRIASAEADPGIESEPNDRWQDADPIDLGRPVFGTADDIEYLLNKNEGKSGLDWFTFEWTGGKPVLAYFAVDLLDRDVPCNIKCFRQEAPDRDPTPYLEGKDPTEIVHDQQTYRYSKFITRVLTKGRYYLEVNANHPLYVLRSWTYPVPPYADPRLAVRAAMDYIVLAGDAWFAQTPRQGFAQTRDNNVHDEVMRCTACHPALFPTQAAVTARRLGYEVRTKSELQYLVGRLYNAPGPIYGEASDTPHDGPDAYWARFELAPSQALGRMGSIVTTYENEITRQPTPHLMRYVGFPRLIYDHLDALPEKENNGNRPLESSYETALEQWKTWDEYARRTGDTAVAASRDHLRGIILCPESVKRVKGIQDRAARLMALCVLTRGSGLPPATSGSRGRKAPPTEDIQKCVDDLFSLQSPDGGWPGSMEVAEDAYLASMTTKESAEYLTGQVLSAMRAAGLHPDREPRLQKAVDFLLAKQQPFGAWLSRINEQFNTPFRETRLAVMALAEACPGDCPAPGWRNRDGAPPGMPEGGDATVSGILARLDGLWEAPDDGRAAVTRRLLPFLVHPEPQVRAHAAAALGRVGDAQAVRPLGLLLGHPAKIVWRAAAEALRRLGDRGIGADEILAALRSPEPRVRRGATRIFAYQFYGLDRREDLLDAILGLADDPDPLVRLQASRALWQWWYRTAKPDLKRRIVEKLVARLGVPGEDSIVRKNFMQALYIVQDENLRMWSPQYWMRDLRKEDAERLLAARREVERTALLGPILSGIRGGGSDLRLALLKSYEFPPFRDYLGGPNLGNDGSFDLLTGAETAADAAFTPALKDAGADVRRHALRLAAAFKAPTDASYEALLVTSLLDADADVRARALPQVERMEVSAAGAESLEGPVLAALGGSIAEARRGALAALRRNPPLLARPTIAVWVETALQDAARRREVLTLVPVLPADRFPDAAVAAILDAAHAAGEDPGAVMETLDRRPALREPFLRAHPKALTEALRNPDAGSRKRAYELLARVPALRDSPTGGEHLRDGLLDPDVEVRKLVPPIVRASDTFWRRPDLGDYLFQALNDTEAGLRKAVLEALAERPAPVRDDPRFAPRVKRLAGETNKDVAAAAANALVAAGVDPAAVKPEAGADKARHLDYAFFKEKVNPIFYRKGRDGHCCAECHASHAILRVAEAPGAGKSPADADVRRTFEAALRVVDAVYPERSLLLCKPLMPSTVRSPDDGGEAAVDSATSLVTEHFGGVRWEGGAGSEPYKTILRWIRGEHSTGPYLRTWAVIGPFANTDLKGLDLVYPPEREIDFGKTYDGIGAEKRAWAQVTFPADSVELRDAHFRVNGEFLCYAYAVVESPSERAAQLLLGSRTPYAVWVNGERVSDQPAFRTMEPDQDAVTIKLKPGRNALLLKVCTKTYSGWNFSCRLACEGVAELKYPEPK